MPKMKKKIIEYSLETERKLKIKCAERIPTISLSKLITEILIKASNE